MPCQANLEMSCSCQNRNVRFSSLSLEKVLSLMVMFVEFEFPPGMIGWRNVRFSLSHHHGLSLLSQRSFGYFFKSQKATLMGDHHGAIDSILDYQLRRLDPILDLIKLLMVGHRKVVSESSFCFNT